MRTVKLNNGVEMPVIGFGSCRMHKEECVNAVLQAIEAGYRLIDTAIMYGNEKEVGEAVRKSGIDRKELFITTKLDNSCASYIKAKNAIDNCLAVMELEYIDMIMVHEPYPGWEGMYEAVVEAYKEGKIRAVGISNFFYRNYDHLLQKYDFVPQVNQIESHVFYPQLELKNYMMEHGTVVQAWAPLANGQNNIFTNPVLVRIGEAHNKTAAQTALKYLLQNGITIIPKSSSPVRMKQNLDLDDFELTAEEMKEIDALDTGSTLYPWTEMWL